jgi:hypothetical protein
MNYRQNLIAGGTALTAIGVVLGVFLSRTYLTPPQTKIEKEVVAMGSFGNAGTRTKRVFKTLVPVNLSKNEHLHYFITVKGANPIFSLSCEHKTLWSNKTFGLPAMQYQRIWPFDPGEADNSLDQYSFSISFTAATKYTFRLERHNAAHEMVNGKDDLMEDIDYESNDHSDQFMEFFTVNTQ